MAQGHCCSTLNNETRLMSLLSVRGSAAAGARGPASHLALGVHNMGFP